METPLVCALSKYLCYCSVVCVLCCVVSFDLTVSGIAGAGGEQFILYFHSSNFIVNLFPLLFEYELLNGILFKCLACIFCCILFESCLKEIV